MKPIASHFVRYAFGSACAAAAAISFCSPGFAQAGPFVGLEGAWAGTGTVALADGSNERIRCRATYAVEGGGKGLQQTLRCASDSYKFDLSSNVTSQGEKVSGSWSEASRGVNGTVNGSASAGSINVFVEAAGFAANLSVTTRGNKQSVAISSKGDIKSVNITMTKT